MRVSKRFGFLVVGMMALARPALAQTLWHVGRNPANPPFEFKNDSGLFEGFEVDLVRAVGGRLGRSVAITELGFEALFAAIDQRRVDVAISSFAITPDRLKTRDFSQPYMDDGLALIAGPSSRLHSLADARGAVLGAVANSTGQAWITSHGAEYDLLPSTSYETAASLFLDTVLGQVDGSITNFASSVYAVRSVDGLRVVERLPVDTHIGMMLPKGSPDTVLVNDALLELKRDGTVSRLYKKWFAFDPAPSSSTVALKPAPVAD